MLYKCGRCGAGFSHPELEDYVVVHSELDTGNIREYRTIEHCPECNSTDLLTADYCPTCGEITDDEYCPECLAKVTHSVEGLEKELKTDWPTVVDLVNRWCERN